MLMWLADEGVTQIAGLRKVRRSSGRKHAFMPEVYRASLEEQASYLPG